MSGHKYFGMKLLLIIMLSLFFCSCGSNEDAIYEISAEELGFQACLFSVTDAGIADAEILEDGGLRIYAGNLGTTIIEAQNSYGEAVEVTVTVSSGFRKKIAVAFTKFEMPENYVNVLDFGVSEKSFDNARAFQAAINALPDGGVIYVPKGRYYTSFVQLKDNITLRLEGILPEYNTEYSGELAERINNNTEFAIIESASKGNDMFANHERYGYGREGADNITITGGMLDMNGMSRCLIFCCAENVLLENVIMKDCPNNHAIQICGSKNVTIRNVMFAGYAMGENMTTAEMIQIEESNPLCIGKNSVAATVFDEYEFYSSENIVIENCYFGASDEYSGPSVAIAHHGSRGKYAAYNVNIVDCTFDNLLLCAVRAYGWKDVEISECRFISQSAYDTQEEHSMLELQFPKGTDVQIEDNEAYLVMGYERGGCKDINIHDNEFHIGAESKMGGILQTNEESDITFEIKAENEILVTDFYQDEPYIFTGYKEANNLVSDVSLCNNRITIENEVNGDFIRLNGVNGLEIGNNQVTAVGMNQTTSILDGEKIVGAVLDSCIGAEEKSHNFVISATSANKTIPIVMSSATDDNIEVFCTAPDSSAYYTFTLTCRDGGKIVRSVTDEGSVYVEAIAEDGYVFMGYYVNDAKINTGRFEFTGETEVVAVFEVKQ